MKTVTFDEQAWILVPRVPNNKQLADTAFNLCSIYGNSFVRNMEAYSLDAYREMLANAPELKPESENNKS